jgi:hypothetical protein
MDTEIPRRPGPTIIATRTTVAIELISGVCGMCGMHNLELKCVGCARHGAHACVGVQHLELGCVGCALYALHGWSSAVWCVHYIGVRGMHHLELRGVRYWSSAVWRATRTVRY